MKKLSKLSKFSVIILSLFVLSACSTSQVLKNRENHYAQAKGAPVLQVPQGVSSVNLGTDYPVSGEIAPNGQTPSLVPPGSLAASGVKK